MSIKKKVAVISVYVLAVVALAGSVFFLQRTLSSLNNEEDSDFIYVSRNALTKDIPVVGTSKTIIRPYNDSAVQLVKSFYDYQAEKEAQEKSLIYYEKTYIQNSGVDYSGEANNVKNFEVVSILDGVVSNVKEDELLGKVIEIKYDNDIIASYQGLSEVSVKKDDPVTQGQVIGKSGTSNISTELKDHLHFELYYQGKVVDPEKYFDKKLEEL